MNHGLHVIGVVISALLVNHVELIDVYKLLDPAFFHLIVLNLVLDLLLVELHRAHQNLLNEVPY